MRASLNRRYKMLVSVRDVLANRQTLVNSTPMLRNRADEFTAQFTVIDAGTTLGIETTEGATETKNILRERLVNACFSLANAIWSHADDAKDESLKARIPNNLSDFQYGKDAELLGRYRAVIKEAQELRGIFEAFGIDTKVVDDAAINVEEFARNLNAPKTLRNTNSVKLANWQDNFKSMDGTLERLDRIINAMRIGQVEFYQEYTRARVLGTSNAKKEKAPEPRRANKFPVPTSPVKPPVEAEEKSMDVGSPFDKR